MMRTDLIWRSYWGSADVTMVKDFEQEIGKKFPADYVEIVVKYNGAYVIGCDAYRFRSNFTGNVETYGLGLLHAFAKTDSVTDTIRWSYDHKPFGFPDYLVSFSRDGGGNLLCFDYSKDLTSNDPEIVLWHVNAQPGTGREISFVAKSFSIFLEMLFEE